MHTRTVEQRNALSPADAVELLRQGNERFRTNRGVKRDLLGQVNETQNGQHPIAAVVSCMDSRTSAELIFDQGLGDIFSIRIAGNVVNEDILGSLEFACKMAGAKAIVVLGHSRCGAVMGACDGVEVGHLSGLLAKIRPVVHNVAEPSDPASRNSGHADFVEAVARENVRQGIDTIRDNSAILGEMEAAGDIEIVGAIYSVATGEVSFASEAP